MEEYRVKKWIKNSSVFFLIIIIVASFVMPIQATTKKTVELVFTHDLHSHLEPFKVNEDGKEKLVGGFARLKTYLDERRKENNHLLVLDGGDFSMGTLFQTIYEQEASELRLLGQLGFDATVLGNHEFDYRTEGLLRMMKTANESNQPIPEVLLCNGKLEQTPFESIGIKPYTIIERGEITTAVIGVFGEDALKCAPTCELEFEEAAVAVQRTIDEIKAKQEIDLFVCVSHSGTNEDKSKSEDEVLAKKVPELDVIVSGHTHSTLEKPIQVGTTYIVSCGEYGAKIGNMVLEEAEDGWKLQSYQLISLDEQFKEDEAIAKQIQSYRKKVDGTYLKQFGYEMDEVLVNNPYPFTAVQEIGRELKEEPLGSFIADSYIYAVKQMEQQQYKPIAAAIVPSGVIRDTIPVGNVTVSDAFNISSLGIGPDQIPGYPLVSVYLTGKELKTAAEIDVSISPFMPAAQLYSSGLQYSYNHHRMILNRVMDTYLVGDDGKRVEIEEDKLYRVVADLYSGQMLSTVSDTSYGILSVVPKDETGKPIENLEDYIIKEEGKELKAWVALATYMESFQSIPSSYQKEQGRKQGSSSYNPVELFKNINLFSVVAILLISLIIVVVVVVIRWIRRMIKKRKERVQIESSTK